MAAAGRAAVVQMLRTMGAVSCRCPAHSTAVTSNNAAGGGVSKEYAVEMATSNIRYGRGVTREVGQDFANMRGVASIAVFTDRTLSKLPPVSEALQSLDAAGVKFDVYDKTRVEPTDSSFNDAVRFAYSGNYDAFLAVGGGSVIDTAKAANLMFCHPESDMMDFVSRPIGKGLPVKAELKPLIAIPTTAGTGSETTGTAVFDYEKITAKTGIASRALRPTLGLVDPAHTLHMPERVAANGAFDVLCHALESYTALPYYERSPRPDNPLDRPAYQGSNPISDVWSLHALRIFAKFYKRSIFNADDLEARSQMHLASTFAGIGFGNAGVHLCHGLSYAISGQVRSYRADNYDVDHAIIPHGLSVILTAPAVFQFTSCMCPERHLEAAEILGADIANVRREDAGLVLADTLRRIMRDTKVADGLTAVGYTSEDIPSLVKGTLPQERVTRLSPRPQTEEDLATLFQDSLTVF